MNFLLDTNTLSEFKKLSPNPGVVDWFDHAPSNHLFLSVLTLGELNKGIEKLTPPRFQVLHHWLHVDVMQKFSGRIIAVDDAVAMEWGKLVGKHHRPLPVIDSLLAATALTHHLTLVTRNMKDFSDIKHLKVINPFSESVS